ncbi:MAG: cellulase family glycosylhydrolase [Firmicutes bacterium]|nr:cellulase family glycosylhydrolase [Bacillota bacterium]
MDKIKGVNLGGWFVLESWMKPSLFSNVQSKDETGFSLQNPNAKNDLIDHWETFITKADFLYLKSIGINSLRLPIPWWFQGDAPYFSALPYIHRAMLWATEVGLDVLLDLHTAPGCQNGFDNGGIEGMISWHLDSKNIKLTVDKLEYIAQTFSCYSSFWGIEVLNEPHVSIDMQMILDFYSQSYAAIRKHTDKIIVFHDAFRPTDEAWKEFFTNKNLHHVMFDLHLYHCFDPQLTHGSFDVHIDLLLNKRLPMILEISKYVDVLIAEWSLGMRYETMNLAEQHDKNTYRKILADLQLYVYSHAKGHYFWSYKIESDRLDWDFRKLIEQEILPNKY